MSEQPLAPEVEIIMTGRIPTRIEERQLRALLQMNPSLAECARFFNCSESTIEKHIRRDFNVTFSELRAQCLIHTRHELVRRALKKAMEDEDGKLLIFCLKNLAGWSDKADVNMGGFVAAVTSEPIDHIKLIDMFTAARKTKTESP